MSDLAGQLEIRLDASSGAVAISSSRPVTAARVFAGKSPAEVVRLLPTLFSLCGTAQAAACVGACEQALGRKPNATVLARRQALVHAETIKEHLWRLLLDWPQRLEPWAETRPTVDASARINANANARVSTEVKATLPAASAIEAKAMSPATSAASAIEAKAMSPAASAASAIEAKATSPATSAASAMPQVMRAFLALRQAQQAAGDPFTLNPQQAEQGAAAVLDPSALLELVTEQALGASPGAWLQVVDSPAALQRWAEQIRTPAAAVVRAVVAQGLAGCGANPVARLPEAPLRSLAELLASVDADAFIAAPRWQRECAETGPLARMATQPLIAALLAEHGNGLLTRLVALLVDLAQSARGLEATLGAGMEDRGRAVQSPLKDAGESFRPSLAGASEWELSSGQKQAVTGHETRSGVDAGIGIGIGIGIGAAEAARGLLVHRIRITEGRIAQYQILAPTEWNFHPAGVVAQGLTTIARSGIKRPELERLARLYITAVDPCVDYQLSVS